MGQRAKGEGEGGKASDKLLPNIHADRNEKCSE